MGAIPLAQQVHPNNCLPIATTAASQADHVRRRAGEAVLKRLCAHNGAVKVLGDDAVRFLAVTTAPPIAWHTLQYQLTQCSPSDRPPRATLSNFYAPRRYPVGITSATAESRCSIAGARWGRRFASRPINRFLASLFEELPEALAGAGLQKVDLSRFDLHHAHVFATNDALGLLFHACEYPAYCDQHFPVNLGFCQAGSTVAYAIERMRWRNIVWMNGRAACLDIGPSSPLVEELLMDGLQDVFTVLENDLGTPLCDVYYINELHERKPEHRIFVVPR